LWAAPSRQKDWADTDTDEDMSFEGPSFSSSFSNESPSAIPSPTIAQPLPSKFQATNKDVAGSYGDGLSMGPPRRPYDSGSDDSLVTPCIDWNAGPTWPEPMVHGQDGIDSQQDGVDVDEFIQRTLAEAAKGPAPGVKKAPGTPVKKVRTLGLDRPWQSAAVSKIGLKDDCDFPSRGGHGNAPRKSLPAAFPGLKSAAKPRGVGKSLLEQCNSDSEGEEESPSGRKNGKYATASLGLGHPPPLPPGAASVAAKGNPPLFLQKGRWLSRRSSSGQFSTISSGSESTSQTNTPTRAKGNGESIRVSTF
jgi:mitosis inhibitor protein kinase SWE1